MPCAHCATVDLATVADVTDLATRARTLLDLHTAPEILVLANVWDVVSARVVAGTDGVRALATASHSIAGEVGSRSSSSVATNHAFVPS